MKKTTVLIPHYKTLDLTKKCLELIRLNTDLDKVEVIVIDNGSKDQSTEYLKNIEWIDLIIREPAADDTPVRSHARALDLALEQVKTPYILSIHTDTFALRPDWLSYLLRELERADDIAGVGSWKLEQKPFYKRVLKAIEKEIQLLWCKLSGNKKHAISGIDGNHFYLRSHCALYRTDLIKKLNTGFADGDDTAGKVMHRKLVDAGYQMVFLPANILGKYIAHINHATSILCHEIKGSRKSKRRKINIDDLG